MAIFYSVLDIITCTFLVLDFVFLLILLDLIFVRSVFTLYQLKCFIFIANVALLF